MNTAEMTDKMVAYFADCVSKAKDRSVKRYEKPIASEGGLCKALDISRDQLRAMEQGTDAERRFFGQYTKEYEIAVDAMHVAGLLTDQVYKELKASFRQAAVSDERTIILQIPDFHAPEDWEDYKDLRKVLDDQGLTFKQGIMVLRKASK